MYRIIQKIVMEVFATEFAESRYLATFVKNAYFLSEMIMIIGICISIKKSVNAAKAHKSQQ